MAEQSNDEKVRELSDRMKEALAKVQRVQSGLKLLHAAALEKANGGLADVEAQGFCWDVINQLELVEADLKAANELTSGYY